MKQSLPNLNKSARETLLKTMCFTASSGQMLEVATSQILFCKLYAHLKLSQPNNLSIKKIKNLIRIWKKDWKVNRREFEVDWIGRV